MSEIHVSLQHKDFAVYSPGGAAPEIKQRGLKTKPIYPHTVEQSQEPTSLRPRESIESATGLWRLRILDEGVHKQLLRIRA